MITDEQYGGWISALKERYQRCQIKASVSVNREMLVFYWCLGVYSSIEQRSPAGDSEHKGLFKNEFALYGQFLSNVL